MQNQHNHRRVKRLMPWSSKRDALQKDRAMRFASESQAALDAASEPMSARSGLTLADLRPGQCADITHLVGTSQSRLRLLEMGLTPGTHVRVLRIAAFGGPLDIQVRGYQLSLRREEAMSVWLGAVGQAD